MLAELKFSRRMFLGASGGAGVAIVLEPRLVLVGLPRAVKAEGLVSAQEDVVSFEEQVPTVPEVADEVLGQPEMVEVGERERKKLEKHIETCAGEKESVLRVVWEYRLMDGERSLSREQIYFDLKKYFDIYKAAEFTYKVPWFLLWHTHIKETTSSRNPNPGAAGYRGSMQRNPGVYGDAYVKDASTGWEFLGLIASGYGDFGDKFGFHDYEEIFGAARKMSEDAWGTYGKGFIELTHQERMGVLRRYCSPENAANRAITCNRVAPYLGVVLKP